LKKQQHEQETRDVLLFRNDSPSASRVVFWKNLAAVSLLPIWLYMAYFARHLKVASENG